MLVEEKKLCCGCGACLNICPQKCIKMVADDEGFQYPEVDDDKCINCGMCKKACPIVQKNHYYKIKEDSSPRTIGGWHKDENVRYDSSSGGAFTLLAEYILSEQGVVYGCTLNEDMVAVHVGITCAEELGRLRGSKYVQSDINEVYRQIKELLIKERLVLFVGTPCQCAGLHSFLMGAHYEKLYTVDFICHGVPSPKVFRDYIEYLEKKNDDKIEGFRFRNKDKSWKSSGMQMGTEICFQKRGKKRFSPAYKDSYMNGFLDDVYLRPSCYKCEFKSLPKYYADFTIADFWGVDSVDKELNDGKGTSLILIHNDKGETLFGKVKDNFVYKDVEFEKAIKRNQSLIKSSPLNPHRQEFFSEYANTPFEKTEKKYMSAWVWAIHKISKIAWKCIEKILIAIITPFLKAVHKDWKEAQWNALFQFVKFSLVGVSNVVVSYLINILTLLILRPIDFRYDYVVSNLAAFSLSVLWAFHWNHNTVFGDSVEKERKKWKKLIKTYFSYGFTGIILNSLLAILWIEVLHISKFISPLLNLPITVPLNFLLQKLWVYKEKNK